MVESSSNADTESQTTYSLFSDDMSVSTSSDFTINSFGSINQIEIDEQPASQV